MNGIDDLPLPRTVATSLTFGPYRLPACPRSWTQVVEPYRLDPPLYCYRREVCDVCGRSIAVAPNGIMRPHSPNIETALRREIVREREARRFRCGGQD